MQELLDRLKNALADHYEIERHLGEGGMAQVYLAHDVKHDRGVAVKVLRPELSAILGGERFLNEIKVMANLQHPNILPLYDSGEVDSFLYYVMPHIEGETLRDMLNREKQLDVDQAIEIAKAVAAALDFAHEHGVVHRDIKPENILFQAGQAMVADFGIALAVSAAGGTRLTETGLSLGTPHYMSPEQATGDREVDARSDVYSLGAVVYEMLVGEPPHVGNSVQAIIAKILSDTPTPITRARELVSPNVDAAVHRALARSPADRFATAAQFAEALADPTFTLPTAPVQGGAAPAPPSPWNRLSVAGWGVAAALMALVVALLMRPEQPRPVSRYSVSLPEVLWGGVTSTTRLAVTPDGGQLVYVGVGDDGQRQLLTRERAQLHATGLPGTVGAASPFASPDGERVGYFVGGELRIASLAGAPPITRTDSGIQGWGGSWGRDDNIYVSGPDGLARLAAAGGVLEPITTRDTTECAHAWPDVGPKSKVVVFTIFGFPCTDLGQYRIGVADVLTGEYRELIAGVRALYAASGHLLVVTPDGTLLAAPFDPDRREIGPATPISEGIAVRSRGAVDIALSATGKLHYVTGLSLGAGQANEAVWIARSGLVSLVDPMWKFESVGNAGWALSPDGNRLAIKTNSEAGQDIYVKRLDTGPSSRLTFDPAQDIRPRWTPDGQSVSFTSDRGGEFDLYVRRADGTGAAEQVLDLDQTILEAAWSADGKWLVVRTGGVAGQAGGRDIWGLELGVDSVPVPLVTSEYDERAIALSPDGRWLAYQSDETGRDEVYVRPFPDAEGGKWQVSTAGGRAPLWAHSATELFYITPTNELVAAQIAASQELAWTTTPLFTVGPEYVFSDNYTWFDVAPDDQRFLFVRIPPSVGDASETIVVENFFEELRARVRSE